MTTEIADQWSGNVKKKTIGNEKYENKVSDLESVWEQLSTSYDSDFEMGESYKNEE